MAKVTKAELIEKLAAKMELKRREVSDFLVALKEIVQEEVASGNEVIIPDIVKLFYTERNARAERVGRIPFSGEKITIPARPPMKVLKAVVYGKTKKNFRKVSK